MNDPLPVPDKLSADRVAAWIGIPRAHVRVLDEAPSTNAELAAWAGDGAPNGAIVVADAQTAGRGRKGRVWHSPPGVNLYVSMLFDAEPLGEDARLFVYAAGAALFQTAADIGVSDAMLKWPNDLYAGGKKIAGVLCETHAGRHALIAGLGVNVNLDPRRAPPDIALRAASFATLTGRPHDRAEVLALLYRHLDGMYKSLIHDRAGLLDLWRRGARIPGARYVVDTAEGRIRGPALGLADDGALLIDDERGERRVYSGDVVAISTDGQTFEMRVD
ncbi:biotin--[acetyl-CoA-carboxylase] ligase [bacterium]|nr:biotin--[acetyl-CoA-carboxylase] ligase [bacterium]